MIVPFETRLEHVLSETYLSIRSRIKPQKREKHRRRQVLKRYNLCIALSSSEPPLTREASGRRTVTSI